jgi:hypothetical protein
MAVIWSSLSLQTFLLLISWEVDWGVHSRSRRGKGWLQNSGRMWDVMIHPLVQGTQEEGRFFWGGGS